MTCLCVASMSEWLAWFVLKLLFSITSCCNLFVGKGLLRRLCNMLCRETNYQEQTILGEIPHYTNQGVLLRGWWRKRASSGSDSLCLTNYDWRWSPLYFCVVWTYLCSLLIVGPRHNSCFHSLEDSICWKCNYLDNKRWWHMAAASLHCASTVGCSLGSGQGG